MDELVFYNMYLIISDHFLFEILFVRPGSSVVEHLPEEQSVGGSIPSLGTIHFSIGATLTVLLL